MIGIISFFHSQWNDFFNKKIEFSFYLLLLIIWKNRLTNHIGETPQMERDNVMKIIAKWIIFCQKNNLN